MRLKLSSVAIVALCIGAAAALSPGVAMANNDPNRVFLGFDPATSPPPVIDLPAGFCSFPTELTLLVDNEYGTVTTAVDGSTSVKATGNLVVQISNQDSGAEIVVNASGPGTVTNSGNTEYINVTGQSLFFWPNWAEFGLPSGLVLYSGQLDAVQDNTNAFPNQPLVALNSRPHVQLDVCAALS